MKKTLLAVLITLLLSITVRAQVNVKVRTTTGPVPLAVTSHSVDLTWTQSSNGAGYTVTGNKLYRAVAACSTNPSFSLWFTSTVPIITYTDTSVSGGSTYCYVVTAVANCPTCNPTVVESAYSNPANAAVPPDTVTVPPPVMGTPIVAMLPTPHVDLAWTWSGSGTATYSVWRKSSTSNGFVRRVSGLKTMNWTDTSVAKGKTYLYEAKATSNSQTSTFSNTVQAIIQ